MTSRDFRGSNKFSQQKYTGLSSVLSPVRLPRSQYSQQNTPSLDICISLSLQWFEHEPESIHSRFQLHFFWLLGKLRSWRNIYSFCRAFKCITDFNSAMMWVFPQLCWGELSHSLIVSIKEQKFISEPYKKLASGPFVRIKLIRHLAN